MIRQLIVAFLVSSALAWPSVAGTRCSQLEPNAETIANAARAAELTLRTLEQTNAEAVILARVGSDISEYGLRYTHAAFAFRDHPKGRWLVRHLLNECATDRSGIYDQGLFNFFLDDLYAYEALIIVPSRNLQDRLKGLVLSSAALVLHQPKYSMIASPFDTRYQNSNQWLLEMIALAQAPAGLPISRPLAQELLRSAGYRPSQVSISPFKALGASILRANVRFDDHSSREREIGRYDVVSVRSVKDYLIEKNDIGRLLTVGSN
jgi:hypothetical protein